MHAAGTHVLSTDEMTGLQALARAAPTRPLRPGQVERREFASIRHGTQRLIATFAGATGQVVRPSLEPTRTEADFAAHIAHPIATEPTGGWVFIGEQLNTHQSEALVRLVAAACAPEVEVGEQGPRGILASMATRAAFLGDPTHRIRFVSLPKHTSWLKQGESWFSILVRRLLKRASFTSTADLRDRILAFIASFNRALAKPFQWTDTGRPLVV